MSSRLRSAFERRSISAPDATGYPSGYPSSNGTWGTGMVWSGSSNSMTTETAMLSSAVFACLRLISEAVATLPLETFRTADGEQTPYALPDFLAFHPPGVSRIDYVSQVMLSLLTDGNAYVATPRDATGGVSALIPLDPTRVQVKRTSGVITYVVGGHEFSTLEIMHIAGMQMPGSLLGVSPITYARETLSLDRDARRFGQSFFANGALPSAIIETPDKMSDEAAAMFRETWNGNHQGVGNANRVGVLTEGAKLNKVSIAPDDAQFLQTRQFSIPDIARIYGAPPHLIGDATNSTSWGSGLAEQNLAFGQFTLRPWTERFDGAHSRLLTTHGLPNVSAKLNLDGLLRASLKDRYDAAAVGVAAGFLRENEARAWENLPPLPESITKAQADALGSLVRSGFEPAAACAVLGLPPIAHTGSLPVTVQAEV